MEKRTIFLIAVLFFSLTSLGKTVQTELKVHGDCMGCKVKIEDALDIKGITYAEWDHETKILVLKYNDTKVTIDEIKTIINELGYKVEDPEST